MLEGRREKGEIKRGGDRESKGQDGGSEIRGERERGRWV